MIKKKTNGNIRYENYKGKFLFPMKYFVSFGKDSQSIYFMPTRLLKENIYGLRVIQLKYA